MFEHIKNGFFSLIFTVSVMILVITVSIGLPIYVRPFYYVQVDTLDLAEKSGYTREQIIEAYDEVLDFLTLEGREFGTGELLHSEDGKRHFEDCKVLFDLNRNAMIISFCIVVLLIILNKIGKIHLYKPLGLRLSFWSSIFTLGGCLALGAVCAINFERAFQVFHHIFFPGKDNWMFDIFEDEIIMVMPEEFFLSCAVLICLSLLTISLFLIFRAVRKKDNDVIG